MLADPEEEGDLQLQQLLASHAAAEPFCSWEPASADRHSAQLMSKPLCDQILPGLFLGPVEAEQSPLEVLKQLGVTHVLRFGCQFLPRTHAAHLHYLEVDVFDRPDCDLLKHLKNRDTNGFIEDGRASGGVLVHCVAGVSRSATAVVAYIMCKDKVSAEKALAFVKDKRARTSPNPGFRDQLKMLEVECDCDIKKYSEAPGAPYLTVAERQARGEEWLAQRSGQAATSGAPHSPAKPWKARFVRSHFPPTED